MYSLRAGLKMSRESWDALGKRREAMFSEISPGKFSQEVCTSQGFPEKKDQGK